MIGLEHFLEIGLYESIILATKEVDDQEGGMNEYAKRHTYHSILFDYI